MCICYYGHWSTSDHKNYVTPTFHGPTSMDLILEKADERGWRFLKYLFIYLVVLGLSCSTWAP